MPDSDQPTPPPIHELMAYVKEYGASAAARHYNMGYSVVRRKIRQQGLHLRRGRRRDKNLAQRNAEIRVMRMRGRFLIDIGRVYDLGRERVRQILDETGGDPLKPAMLDPALVSLPVPSLVQISEPPVVAPDSVTPTT